MSFAAVSFAAVPFAAVPFAAVSFAAVSFAAVSFAAVPFAAVSFAAVSFAAVSFAAVSFATVSLATVLLAGASKPESRTALLPAIEIPGAGRQAMVQPFSASTGTDDRWEGAAAVLYRDPKALIPGARPRALSAYWPKLSIKLRVIAPMTGGAVGSCCPCCERVFASSGTASSDTGSSQG